MRQRLLLLPLIAAAALVSGCATLGVNSPHSLDERLAYAYGTYAGVENGLADARLSGALSRATATKLQAQTDRARALLDAARAAEQADPASASGLLAKAVVVLAALQAALPASAHAPPAAPSTPAKGAP